MSLTIAQASARTGLSIDTLRYYERDGLLLRPVARSATGHRRYDEADLEWVRLVTCLRATGMPVREVRRYADLVRAGDGTEQDRLDLLHEHREQVIAQLEQVTAHLSAIERKIGLYTEKLHGAETERAGGLDLERAPAGSLAP
ncbi:MerR family transcriptional regulator [Nocardioides ferulae]|uniref:MerR family transcriptional regulator n=1 Tax=Nocardioides ferulae TaxID=2340821 RepID=UPI000EB1327B|nr:MerR family transcriptional regulator [Nocardioides ferulae]